MRDHNIGCLPVGNHDHLIGILTDRDLACRAVARGLDAANTKVSEVMTKGVTWCFEDETVDDVVQRMEDKQIHHLPVLNRQKRLIGILSLSDLALRGPTGLSAMISRLASRDATRHTTRRH
jgi:CBS domain-containing protein